MRTGTRPACRLAAYRTESGLTQQELATRLGLADRQRVWEWEHGVRRPRYERMQEIAGVFGVRVEELWP